MGILEWLFKIILEFFWGKASTAAGEAIEKEKSRSTTVDNARELEKALEGESDDEIKKRSEDLLNGNRN